MYVDPETVCSVAQDLQLHPSQDTHSADFQFCLSRRKTNELLLIDSAPRQIDLSVTVVVLALLCQRHRFLPVLCYRNMCIVKVICVSIQR